MIKIIQTNGETLDKTHPDEPSNGMLKLWIGCKYIEIVRVFYEGQYEQLIVDETSALTEKSINKVATDIYHENVRIYQPELLIDAPSIYGIAVLLTGSHKLT